MTALATFVGRLVGVLLMLAMVIVAVAAVWASLTLLVAVAP